MIANAPVVKELSMDMVEGLIKYITANPEITCDHKDNIKVIL